MMSFHFLDISIVAFQPSFESMDLARLLTNQQWPFHAHSNVSVDQILQSVYEENYSGESNQTFWIIGKDAEKIGVIRLFEMDDLEDGAQLFDIRILNKFQGLGIGVRAVKWLTNYLFDGLPSLQRVGEKLGLITSL